MRVALAQINPTTGDVAGNAARIAGEIARARAQHADLVVFPEMSLPGYCLSDRVEDRVFLRSVREALDELARGTHGIAAVIGFVDHDPSRTNEDGTVRKYNAAAVVQDGRIQGLAYKTLLPNYRYFDDKRYFSPGETWGPIGVARRDGTLRLGISICEDMWDEAYATKPVATLAAAGADLMININASPFYPGKFREREAIITRHIARMRRPFLYVNTVGAGDNGKNIIPFDGHSVAYGADGRLIAEAPRFEEALQIVDIDPATGCGAAVTPRSWTREQELFDALVMSLADYAHKVGFTRAIVPVSGGIDSALGLAITVAAFGPDNVAAYNLPSAWNSPCTIAIAEQLARNLGVGYTSVPIEEIVGTVRSTFERHVHPIRTSVADENLQSRIRGLLMMLESNDSGALLISNGNETEIALGYATLYGDMCGGISIIGDVSKTDVYAVARYANERWGREVIPAETFTIRPSAELAADQYDPFDYSVVSPIVGEIVEKRRAPHELLELFRARALDPGRFAPDADGRTVYDKHSEASFRDLLRDIDLRIRRSVYKRLQGPPIVVVSERAFGFDLRETIIDGWRLS